MAVRPPRSLSQELPKDPISASLEHEILAEKAATHGRLLKQLEKTLAALNDPETDTSEESRLDAAGEALWHIMVQRDLCGFRNTEAFLRELKIPAAVRLRMGVTRPSRANKA